MARPLEGECLTKRSHLSVVAGWRKQLLPTARAVLLKQCLRDLDLGHFSSVLVIGAGKDPYRSLFAPSCRYVAANLYPYGHEDLLADAHALPFSDQTFECVFASEVVEHLGRPGVFATEARRVLAPGGQLILTVPFLFHTHGDPFDFTRFTADGLRGLCREYSTVEVHGQGNRLHVISDLITTAWPRALFIAIRIANHLLRFTPGRWATRSRSTAPSGFVVVATR